MTRIAVFGLGEAGALIATELATQGIEVIAYDPRDVRTPSGVHRVARSDDAVHDSAAVLAFTASADARSALEQSLGSIPQTAVYADFSSSAPALKVELAAKSLAARVRFADVALMSTVPGKGLQTPALVSGTGADDLVRLLGPLGMPIVSVGNDAGSAATRKLLRSVVMKGLAAIILEAMSAANAAGLAVETWENVVEQLTSADPEYIRRLVEGTALHAERRMHEMEATARMLAELGVEPRMTLATVESLAHAMTHGLPFLPASP
jgi:3-hydroxyisobutyrate dehydrogenase-like beta-hydroxyacid dehydrogenase